MDAPATPAITATTANYEVPEGIVLPSPPSEALKNLYLKSGRWFVCLVGIFSASALTTGMVFFVVAAQSYWFSVFIAVFSVYLFLSYAGVSVWGRDFDIEAHTALVGAHAGYIPWVDVYLPVCGEPMAVLNNTWSHIARLEHTNTRVYVLDDSACADVEALAKTFGFSYLVRPNRPELKKAGNLRFAFAQTHGELIVIFDADFCPRPDFLKETLPYFAANDKLAILQTPQFFEVRPEQTWVERGAGIVQELFYRFVQVNRDAAGGAVCVGTCGVYRRSALEPFGGTAAIGYSEDVHTGFSVVSTGWTLKYIPLILSSGVCPYELRAFFVQQYRWCMGSTTLFTNPEFWKSSLTKRQKLNYFTGMMYYQATALAIFVTPIPSIVMLAVRPAGIFWFNIAFAIPSIVFSMLLMPLWCKQHYAFSTNQLKVVQNYAHAFAIKDKLLGSAMAWVPTGGGGNANSRRFTQAKWLCVLWTCGTTGAGVGLAVWRIVQGLAWWNLVPMWCLYILNVVLNLPLMLA